MGIGGKIRQLRLKSNKTQREIADGTGLAVAYLSRLENGRISPSIRTLTKISATLGVPVRAFFESQPGLEQGDRCPVSLSGGCILEHPFVSRGRRPRAEETYTSEQMELLQQCNYLLHKGNRRIITALTTVIRSLLVLVENDQTNEGEELPELTELEEVPPTAEGVRP